ncbi:MAG: hypothetical protein ACOYK3_00725 [Flavobacterium sp.]
MSSTSRVIHAASVGVPPPMPDACACEVSMFLISVTEPAERPSVPTA